MTEIIEMSPETIARVCHEVNRAYCASLGDYSHAPFESAPQWQKMSLINGVHAHLKALSAGEDLSPEKSHENWMAEKVATGWTYGEKKDPEAKTHPCLLPYDQLPPEQRAKDSIFGAVIRELADIGDIPRTHARLRDQFAAAVASGDSGPLPDVGDEEFEAQAQVYFRFADAMIKARYAR